MSKSDGFMYTGITSGTTGHISVREQAKDQKNVERHELEPFAPAIFDLIEKEKATLGTLLGSLINSSQTDAEIRAHVEAVKIHADWLTTFEAQVKNKLRLGRKSHVLKDKKYEI